MSISHESIAKTLTHIYFGDAIWYSRIADPSYPLPRHDASPHLISSLKNGLACTPSGKLGPMRASDADIARQVPFKSRFVGNAGLPAWQIVMHVVNHGTLHRGQVVGMLRQLGAKPPATDIVLYYYEQTERPAS